MDVKICMISSHGGHFRALLDAVDGVMGEHYYVTFDSRHTRSLLTGKKHYFVTDPHLSLLKYFINSVQSIQHLAREKPDVVISTGAGIAVPTMVFAKYLLKSKIVFMESAANVNDLSRTGRFAYRMADLFLVQWKHLQERYPESRFVGLV